MCVGGGAHIAEFRKTELSVWGYSKKRKEIHLIAE